MTIFTRLVGTSLFAASVGGALDGEVAPPDEVVPPDEVRPLALGSVLAGPLGLGCASPIDDADPTIGASFCKKARRTLSGAANAAEITTATNAAVHKSQRYERTGGLGGTKSGRGGGAFVHSGVGAGAV
jgi:hypothetical protein